MILLHKFYVDMLECPKCHGSLTWEITEESEDRIINAKIICSCCGADYEVRDEIGVFLTPDLPRNDLWAQGESELNRFFNENPKIKEDFFSMPEDELNGADYWFKASYYEMNKDYEKSSAMFKKAMPKIYTKDYIDGWNSQTDYVVSMAEKSNCPIVDIASGKGYLIELLLKNTDNYILGTDFSPVILLRDKNYFTSRGLYNKLSLIAFDGRRTPFKNNSIELMTSNMGIQNIEHPGKVIEEMNRICKNTFLSIMMLFKEEDKIHLDFMAKYGNISYMTEATSLKTFNEENWTCSLINKVKANIEPTPVGKIIEMGIDGLPLEKTTVDFCIMNCKK